MGSHVIRNTKVEDYFINLDSFDTFEEYHERYGDSLMRWYEMGRVVIMDNPPVRANNDVLWDVVFPYGDRPVKKLKTETILKVPPNKRILKALDGDLQLFLSFQDEVLRLYDVMISGIEKMFPKYEIINKIATWRFSVTHTEGLHLDVYGARRDSHFLRVYWNADSYPRVWNCGHHLETILKISGIEIKAFEHPEDLNKQISTEYFDTSVMGKLLSRQRYEGREPSPSDYHTVLFAPNSMWFAHSEYLPHEIVFGRRMVSFSIEVRPESMLDPSLCFSRLGARI